jgi:hypothetical protein
MNVMLLITTIKHQLQHNTFDKIVFEFCSRDANIVAHDLAKFSVNSNSSCNWGDDPPSLIFSGLTNVSLIINKASRMAVPKKKTPT